MERKAKILVVDDEPAVCKSCYSILTREGWEVDTVLSAEEALKNMKEKEYDVVVTDMMMPKISGMDLLKTIKQKTPELSVIMITGYATIKTAVMAIKLGAFDYIPKPFTPEELSSVTARAIERKKLFVEEKEKGEEVEYHRPGGRYYMVDHAWAKVEKDGTVRVGMDYVYQKTVGEISNIDLPFEGDELQQGEVCARITTFGMMRVHKFWAPVSGKVVEVNEELNRDGSLVENDPYDKGWFLRLAPSNLEEDLKNLLYEEECKG